MAKRARKEVPLDQSIEVNLANEDGIVPIIDDINPPKMEAAEIELEEPPEPPPPAAPSVKPKETAPPPQQDETSALRKQIEAMQAAQAAHQAELQAERQARAQAEQRVQHGHARGLEDALTTVASLIRASESEVREASAAYKQALTIGDYDAATEAQVKLSKAQNEALALEREKYDLQGRYEAAKEAPPPKAQQQPQQQADPFEQYLAQFPPDAQKWLRSHPDYVNEPRKFAKLQAAHYDALEESGGAAYTPKYFEALDTQLGFAQPAVDGESEPEPRRAPVSAPVSRNNLSPSTGKTSETKITLSAEEREVARTSGLSDDPAEAERIYAQQKLKLIQMKKNGFYPDH